MQETYENKRLKEKQRNKLRDFYALASIPTGILRHVQCKY